MTLKVNVNDHYFQYQSRESEDAYLIQIWLIIAQIHYKLSQRQAECPRILSKIGQTGLEGQGQWPSFSFPAEYHRIHV